MRLTVGQFQELYSIQKSDLDEMDKEVRSVSVITGLTQWEVEDMKIEDFYTSVADIARSLAEYDLDMKPKKYFSAGNRWYGINYDVRQIRSGQYIELQHFGKGDIVENLHYMLASIVYPVTVWRKGHKNRSEDHARVAVDMQQVDFRDAYASVVFFCKIFNASIEGIRDFLASQTEGKIDQKILERTLTDLQKVMDGYTTPGKLQNLN